MENVNIMDLMKRSEQLVENKCYDAAEEVLNFVISTLDDKKSYPERNMLLCEAYNSLGLIYYKKVEFDRAQSFYNKTIETDEMFAPAYYNRGMIYYRLGDFDMAVKDLKQALSLKPTNKEFQMGFKACQDQL